MVAINVAMRLTIRVHGNEAALINSVTATSSNCRPDVHDGPGGSVSGSLGKEKTYLQSGWSQEEG